MPNHSGAHAHEEAEEPQHALAPAAPQQQPPAAIVHGLQRSAGNAAIARLLSGDAAVSREPAAAPAAPAAPAKTVGAGLMEANRPALEDIRAEALVRMGRLAALEGEGREAVSAVKSRLVDVSTDYDKAYGRYADVIKKARLEARNQQEWTDIAVGIAIGVTVGLCIEGLAVALAVDAAATVAAKGLKAVGKAAAKELGGESAEAGAGILAKATGAFEIAGKDLEPGGLSPAVLKTNVWKSVAELHGAVPRVGFASLQQGLLMSNAEYAIGEIKAHGAGGSTADMSEADASQLVLSVLAAGKAAKEVDKKIDEAKQKFAAIKKAAGEKRSYGDKEMERDIWILWMGSLSKDSNILDLDEIEDYIGPKGLGLVDFGIYTFDEDENEAIAKAKSQADAIKAKQISAMGVAGAAAPTAGQ